MAGAIQNWFSAEQTGAYPLSPLVPVVAGLVGALVATAAGRKKTRLDNLVIGGIFTGFAAYRDPRASIVGTLAIAAIEGAIWGVTDRLVPQVKDKLLPAPHAEPAGA